MGRAPTREQRLNFLEEQTLARLARQYGYTRLEDLGEVLRTLLEQVKNIVLSSKLSRAEQKELLLAIANTASNVLLEHDQRSKRNEQPQGTGAEHSCQSVS